MKVVTECSVPWGQTHPWSQGSTFHQMTWTWKVTQLPWPEYLYVRLCFSEKQFLSNTPSSFILFYFILFYFILFFVILGLQLKHMEVPRLGVKSELQLLASTTATVMQDLSCVCDLTPQFTSTPGSLTHWARSGIDRTCVLKDSSWVHSAEPRRELLNPILDSEALIFLLHSESELCFPRNKLPEAHFIRHWTVASSINWSKIHI